ncbi:13012_t:CDS:2, partial [Acaulospora morrowiae]
IVKGTPKLWVKLMELCWNADVFKRPTAKQMHGILDKLNDIVHFREAREDILKENLELRDLCGYSSLDEFADDVWEFKLKMFDISCREANHQKEMHPKAIYTSQLISDITKNVQWESNKSVQDGKFESVQKKLEINF